LKSKKSKIEKKMNGKKLTSLMFIGLISLVIGSTYSFFQDTETSEEAGERSDEDVAYFYWYWDACGRT
jgi:predicted ribosomally synthesized peptide with SipW-like signal peptide